MFTNNDMRPCNSSFEFLVVLLLRILYLLLMCGRFTLAKEAKVLRKTFADFPVDPRIQARYNITPGQPVTGWVSDPSLRMELFTWGLIPPWAKDPAFGMNCINARAETVQEKASFKIPFRRKRCMIPADGWYEWKVGPQGKQPYYFRHRDETAFAFAGLWEEWHDREGGLVISCAVITTRPNRLARTIHPRMPAVLREEDWQAWLEPHASLQDLKRMLEPVASDPFLVQAVSPNVNRASEEGPELIEPYVAPQQPCQQELF
ncbi:MAG: SOS response-associated peptidase [Okeania sp. SIO3H1]|nr:SOS response-associated peptidase [Okeania sp. SIO3H1]